MNRKNILFWLFVALSGLFGIAMIRQGISLYVDGLNCHSYNDYACAFRAMFSMVIIPYGFTILLFVGLASLPYRTIRLIGSVFSILLGIVNLWLFCVIALGAASNAGEDLVSQEMGYFLLRTFGMFLGGFALFGVGIIGYLKTK